MTTGGVASTTRFTYDGGRVLEEYDAAAMGAVEASYVYGNYVDEVLTMKRGTANFYYHTDDMFNVMAITDGNGTIVERYEYGDYGLHEESMASKTVGLWA